MAIKFQQRLDDLSAVNAVHAMRKRRIGLEKENLRVMSDGTMSQNPHPQALGSSLTHPLITTDYSEAMLELITPPMADPVNALSYLCDLHRFVYQNIGNELLWATSMPCVLAGGTTIPVAYYGESNQGQMKHIYRVGLGHRYGRVMQVISGVHFNYSISPDFWQFWSDLNHTEPDRQFRDKSYMGMIRNLQRFGWLIPYLFGASPAICKSFFHSNRQVDMPSFDEATYYAPYATSLRMSDIGYTNKKEQAVGLIVNYDSLDSYIASLEYAMITEATKWRSIGIKDQQSRYKQLNTNILQIENEYYSTIRPKQPARGMEKPTIALRERGIEYVELRSLDVNAFAPQGVCEEQLSFIEVLMLYSLIKDSAFITDSEHDEIDSNQIHVARQGRKPGLMLKRHGEQISLQDWALELLNEMKQLAELLDSPQTENPFQRAVDEQIAKVKDADLTPSAIMLQEMREQHESFYQFASRKSMEHQAFFKSQKLSSERLSEFIQIAEDSIIKQQEIENQPQLPFDQYLENYWMDKNLTAFIE